MTLASKRRALLVDFEPPIKSTPLDDLNTLPDNILLSSAHIYDIDMGKDVAEQAHNL